MRSDWTLESPNHFAHFIPAPENFRRQKSNALAASNRSECMTRDEKRRRIREETLRRRDNIPPEVRRELSRTIGGRVIDFIEAHDIDSVMLYLNMRTEVETQDLLVYLLDADMIALAPVIEAEGLVPRRITDPDSQLVRHPFGMFQPVRDVCPAFPLTEIDLILVPGIAFDLQRFRIGYGGGYYDRFLPKCPQATWIGLAFDEQVIQDTLPQAWDVALHYIFSEKCS